MSYLDHPPRKKVWLSHKKGDILTRIGSKIHLEPFTFTQLASLIMTANRENVMHLRAAKCVLQTDMGIDHASFVSVV